MHLMDIALANHVTKRNTLRLLCSGVAHADFSRDAAVTEEELQLSVVSSVVNTEEEIKPLAHHDIEGNSDQRDPDIVGVLNTLFRPDRLVLI